LTRRSILGCVLLLLLVTAITAGPAGADGAWVRSPSPSAVAPEGQPPVTVAHGADVGWHNSAVTVTFTATSSDSAVAGTFVQVDGGAAQTTTEVVVAAPRTHANDGEHVLTFWSVDAAGRAEAPQTLSVKIDTRPPVVSGLRLRPDVLRRVQPVGVSFSLSDLSGGARLSYSVADQYGYLARRGRGLSVDSGAGTIAIPDSYGNGKALVPGLFRVTLTFTDQAGNRTVTRPLAFRDYHPVRTTITYNVKGAGKRVALTFDDGGPAWVWARMLDTLKRYRMHATFFVLGPYVSAAPRAARRAAREGHGIGSHGSTHSEMQREGYAGVRGELLRSEAAWWRAGRVTPVGWFRPPYGSENADTRRAAGSLGFAHLVLWDVDPGDWRGYGASTIAANTLSHVHSGAIIGLHVRTSTMAALPAILSGLRARGYTSVSLPELFHAAGRR
jgi:peptidoglycan/xylan/chitin deacetylase (PgdA/CDA1 family)